jgi:outer membrane receptor for ferrienterochelin and colicins
VRKAAKTREHRSRGRIVDVQGRAVTRAGVTLNNELTGISTSRNVSDSGAFTFPDVGSGAYALTVRAPGFADLNRRIEVQRGRPQQIGDIVLSVIGIDQSVTVVSASRVEELLQDSPVDVVVVCQEQIQNSGYERVGDVLSEIPGIVTRSQSYGVPLPGGEQINGIDSRQTLVLQDGLPIAGARGITEGTIDLNHQEIGRLDRVEVVPGAASASTEPTRSAALSI